LHKRELFAFAGFKNGNIAISNFTEQPPQSLAIRCHADKVSDLCTTRQNSLNLFSSSFDGRVKVLDLSRILRSEENGNYFGDTLIDNAENGNIYSLDVKNCGRELIAVDGNGMLLSCDLRTHRHSEQRIAEKKIASIRIHPRNDFYFVIAE